MLKDGIEAVGMVTSGAPFWPPGLHLLFVMGVVLLLLWWHVGIGQLVMSVQKGFTVSTGDGTDGGVQAGARGGGGGGGALTRLRWERNG